MAKINASTSGVGGLQTIGDNSGTLELQTADVTRVTIGSTGDVLVTNPAGLGYGTGSGGTVTQLTSKATAVTLNKPTGQITMNNAALAAGAKAVFIVNNSLVTSKDVVVVSSSGNSDNNDAYLFRTRTLDGLFTISIYNIHGASLSDAVVLNFAIIKGATA